MSVSPAELRDLARSLAHEGANLAREMQLGGIDVADTKTSAVDVVTEADRAVEALIRDRISALRPDDAVLGEEGDDRPGTSGVRWVVDPIDGTVNYLYGLPDCAVSVAAEVDGEVVAGAVVTIPTGVEYAA
ncbi:MAG TPA: inositol monophosphatase family protein, partial [Nocardioides sp.]